MQSRQTRLRGKDGHLIFVRTWQPQSAPRAVLHISHGMAEHSGRYQYLAQALMDAGYAVVAHDHRGHGNSVNQTVEGHYADEDGWNLVIEDFRRVADDIEARFPNTPRIFLGHSMGSFILMQFLIRHRPEAAAVVLSGSNYAPPLKYALAASIAHIESLRQGKQGKSRLIRQLSFGAFNDRFKPARTPYDWLSRDPESVDRYLEDPLCGFDCSNQLWIDLLGGLYQISLPRNLKQIPAELPFYLLGGTDDPVGQFGKGLTKLARMLEKTGHRQVHLKLYPQGRHEMFNETNRDQVIGDLLHWFGSLGLPAGKIEETRTA